MALHVELDRHLRAVVGGSGYTVTGTSATVTATLDSHQLQELLDKASSARHDCKVVAGVLTVAPRTTSQ